MEMHRAPHLRQVGQLFYCWLLNAYVQKKQVRAP
jgi:hypothetical protein